MNWIIFFIWIATCPVCHHQIYSVSENSQRYDTKSEAYVMARSFFYQTRQPVGNAVTRECPYCHVAVYIEPKVIIGNRDLFFDDGKPKAKTLEITENSPEIHGIPLN